MRLYNFRVDIFYTILLIILSRILSYVYAHYLHNVIAPKVNEINISTLNIYLIYFLLLMSILNLNIILYIIRELIMHLYFNFFNRLIPGYGLMIILGIIIANLIALKIVKQNNLSINHLILLEAYGFLGAGIGAKILYLITAYHEIDWHKLNTPQYLNALLQGGFVFFGGLIGALIFLILANHLHHLNAKTYLQKLIFLLPFAHAFGRLGCYMAGCCYGIPYNGPGHVVFPNNSLAPANIPLFPVQLLEALCLLILSFAIWYLSKHFNYSSLLMYLLAYPTLRFFLEFLRYDTQRGYIHIFSVSQWISLFFIVSTISYILYKKILLSNS